MARGVISTPVTWPMRTGVPRRGLPLWLYLVSLGATSALTLAWMCAMAHDAWGTHRGSELVAVLVCLAGGVGLWRMAVLARRAWQGGQDLSLVWLGAVDKHLRADAQQGRLRGEVPCAGFVVPEWGCAVEVRLRLDLQRWLLLHLRAHRPAQPGTGTRAAWVWVDAARDRSASRVPAQGVGSWHHLRTVLQLPPASIDWPAGPSSGRLRGSMASWETFSHSGSNLSRPHSPMRPRLKRRVSVTGPSSLFPITEWMPPRDEAGAPSSEARP